MKLKCTIGSISCDGVLAEKGDIFEVSEEAGSGLIASGYATEVGIEPEHPEPVESEEVVGSERFDGSLTDEGDSIPDASWVVADIKTWLDGNGIEYPNVATKTKLLSLVDQGE